MTEYRLGGEAGLGRAVVGTGAGLTAQAGRQGGKAAGRQGKSKWPLRPARWWLQ